MEEDKILVVRCKNCRHFDEKKGLCMNIFGMSGIVKEDDYCSEGEQK